MISMANEMNKYKNFRIKTIHEEKKTGPAHMIDPYCIGEQQKKNQEPAQTRKRKLVALL